MEKTIYCANCQTETAHCAVVERGDIIFTCQADNCGRFVKFPANVTAEQLVAAVAAHKAANTGLEYIITPEQLAAAGFMSEEQVQSAMTAISAL